MGTGQVMNNEESVIDMTHPTGRFLPLVNKLTFGVLTLTCLFQIKISCSIALNTFRIFWRHQINKLNILIKILINEDEIVDVKVATYTLR